MSDPVWKKGRLIRGKRRGILFGFQHEDSRVEGALVRKGGRVLCVGSGGETAFALLVADAGEVVAIDVNPAQLLLIRSKLFAMEIGSFDWLTGDASMLPDHPSLPEDLKAWWCRDRSLLRWGLCFSGVVERRTRKLAPLLRWFSRKPGALRWRCGWALLRTGIAMGYSWEFRRRLPSGWAHPLAKRIEEGMKRDPLEPLWLAELGRGFGEVGLPIHGRECLETVLKNRERLTLVEGDLVEHLLHRPEKRWDLIVLSNIADTMDSTEISELLNLVRERLDDDGKVVLRSIVRSRTELPQIESLEWQAVPNDSAWVCPVIGVGIRK